MIVERTNYFARESAEAVLAIRRRASAVRVSIGLSAGRIFLATGSGDDQPDVVWECSFPDKAAHDADLDARAKSPEFAAIRAEMRSAIRDFKRQFFEDDTAPLANGLAYRDMRCQAIVPREIAFKSGAYMLRGYLYLPPGEGPFPLLICNHGSGIDKGTLDVSRPGSAALLMSWGIASFLPHRHGYGNSEGPAWREEASAEFGTVEYDEQLSGRLDRESDDVLAALDVVSAFPEIDVNHIGVMGSSFGGTNTLLAASKTDRFRCAVEFAGAAMNWDKTPGLRALMHSAAAKLTQPVFFIQAENDYSIRPTRELAAELDGSGKIVWSRVYPAFGSTPMEGHLFESRGALLWADDVRHFLEQFL